MRSKPVRRWFNTEGGSLQTSVQENGWLFASQEHDDNIYFSYPARKYDFSRDVDDKNVSPFRWEPDDIETTTDSVSFRLVCLTGERFTPYDEHLLINHFRKMNKKHDIPPRWGTQEERLFRMGVHGSWIGTVTMLLEVLRRKTECCTCTKSTVVVIALLERIYELLLSCTLNKAVRDIFSNGLGDSLFRLSSEGSITSARFLTCVGILTCDHEFSFDFVIILRVVTVYDE